MSYKIAVASSDGEQIDETFGAAPGFTIYEVVDGQYSILEKRIFQLEADDTDTEHVFDSAGSSDNCKPSDGCGTGAGCGDESGAGGSCGSGGCGNGAGGGCGGAGEASAKVELISDCRCVVCKKIGFNIQKQLERKAISAFDVSCPVEEALNKIAFYFNRIDNHQSLRAQ